MSAPASRQSVPETLDAWRQVTARRGFEGRVPLASLQRLASLLEAPDGDAVFSLDFDRDSLGVPYVEVRVEAELPLVCQRTLERFLLPVHIDQRMGLIRDEADEAGLTPGYEPLLVDPSGELETLALVEDELILAVPVVPVKPGTDAVEREWGDGPAVEAERPNPFAALAALKNKPE
ncbi:YceD family protein [Cognatilysobacter terrigena]|uniref:YceD family protein n=1 Tax=Cognatilysobacter terrigena TaxID=2488749 RepID=UPI001060D21F|nr:YceD family protein [Lysobacter terrigena]